MDSGSGIGIKEDNLDRNVSPGEDFYRFACGGWLEANPLPDDFPATEHSMSLPSKTVAD